MPGGPIGRTLVPVPTWDAFSFVFGPLMAFGALGVLVLLLRWAFRRGGSVVAAPARSGEPADYGLLVAVAAPVDAAEGERLRKALEGLGIRTTLAVTTAGLRVFVFPADAERARVFLGSSGLPG